MRNTSLLRQTAALGCAALLTFGLALFYVLPYMNAAEAVFYNEISGRADAFYGREPLEETE